MARVKKEKKKKNVEDEEVQGGKKSKKKLLLIPAALILVAAVAAAAVLFVLPRFGINLLPGSEPGPGEEEPPKNLETFIAGDPIENEDGEEVQDVTISLDTLLEEGEASLIAFRKPGEIKKSGVASSSASSSSSSAAAAPEAPQYTYIYDTATPAALVDRYLDAVLGGEENFVLVDETYLHLEERPVLEDAVGSVTIARKSVQEGHVFQLTIGWSDVSSLVFRASAPEGAIHEPEKDTGVGLGSQVIETVPITTQIETIRGLSPSQLGLDGDSMEGYEIYPVEGFVKVDNLDCRRFNIYVSRGSGEGSYPDLAAIVLLSSDQKHIYRLDPVSNAVTELR